MIPHHAALEAYNRATFDPQTPEIEIAPAETIQPAEHPFRHAVSPWIYCPAWAALAFVLTVIGSLTL